MGAVRLGPWQVHAMAADILPYEAARVLEQINTRASATFGVTLHHLHTGESDEAEWAQITSRKARVFGLPLERAAIILRGLDARGLVEAQHPTVRDSKEGGWFVSDWYSPMTAVIDGGPARLSWDNIVSQPPWRSAHVRATERARLELDRWREAKRLQRERERASHQPANIHGDQRDEQGDFASGRDVGGIILRKRGSADHTFANAIAEIGPRFEELAKQHPELRVTVAFAMWHNHIPQLEGAKLCDSHIIYQASDEERYQLGGGLFFRATLAPRDAIPVALADACRAGGHVLRAFSVPRRVGRPFLAYPIPVWEDVLGKVVDDRVIERNWFPLDDELIWVIFLYLIARNLAPGSLIEVGEQDHGDADGSYRNPDHSGKAKGTTRWSWYELRTPICEASRYACKWGPTLLKKYGVTTSTNEPTRPSWERLRVSESGQISTLDGQSYQLRGSNHGEFLRILMNAKGEPVSASTIEKTLSEKAKRIWDRLPPPIQQLVKRPRRGGYGYRML